MRWYEWKWWRIARSPNCRAYQIHEANITWKHLGGGFYWATKA